MIWILLGVTLYLIGRFVKSRFQVKIPVGTKLAYKSESGHWIPCTVVGSHAYHPLSGNRRYLVEVLNGRRYVKSYAKLKDPSLNVKQSNNVTALS